MQRGWDGNKQPFSEVAIGFWAQPPTAAGFSAAVLLIQDLRKS